MGCVHGKQGQSWQPEHPGETHRRRLPGEKGGGRQKQHGGGGRKEDLGSRIDANDSASAVTNNNSRKPALNFESLPPPRLEIQPCTPRAEVICQIVSRWHYYYLFIVKTMHTKSGGKMSSNALSLPSEYCNRHQKMC